MVAVSVNPGKQKLQHLGPHGPPATAPAGPTPPGIDLSIFTNQSKKLIDFVIAYQPEGQSECHKEYRLIYEEKLKQEGLLLEYEGLEQSQDGKTCFIKIHAPWEVLARTAEINRFKMPIQKSDMEEDGRTVADDPLQEFFCCGKTPFLVDEEIRAPQIPTYFTMEFTKEHMQSFLNTDTDTFFTQTQRILLTWEIMQRASLGTSDIKGPLLKGHRSGEQVGITYLLNTKVIHSAFPLHDADIKVDKDDPGVKPKFLWPLRPWLYETWARPGRWYCYQPLDQIREYFGEKVAMYFAWLGIYTTMLIPLTLFGLFCFIWGLSTLSSDEPSQEVCNDEEIGSLIVCRSCPSTTCKYKELKDSCMFSKLNAVFHHSLTVILALVMALWAVIFLELWKRKQAQLACKWDTIDLGYEYEPPRPEYQATAKEKRRHPITREWEPYIAGRSRMQNVIMSLSVVTFLICIAISVICAVILFKATMVVMVGEMDNPLVDMLGGATVTSLIGSSINACSIIILEKIYGVIAWYLTEKEYPRTMSDFESSYTYKMYIFQFVNYYALLFYLAFVQPTIQAAVTPVTVADFNDQCDPIGCAFFVTTQLIVILVAKQAWNNVMEIFMPKFFHWWKTRKNVAETKDNQYTRFEKDFDLPAAPPLSLLPEYLEMVIQYGVVVLFGAAFPLAPFFALLNNVIEIRIDANKFVSEVRRIIPFRGCDIGNWYSIMEFVTRLSILTNALMIAYTTDLIDRFTYTTLISEDGELTGYLTFILSEFKTADWGDPELMIDPEFGNVSSCWYRGYFNPPGDDSSYQISRNWWIVNLIKVGFVLVFQNLVLWIQEVISYAIPDVPDEVELHSQRNRYISRVAAYRFDKQKRQKKARAKLVTSSEMEKATPEEPFV